jgi:Xaa-Pro aminopeptidase
MRQFFYQRVSKIREGFQQNEAVFINNKADVSYLTGFTGDSSYLFLTKEKVFFITDGRYVEQIKGEAKIDLSLEEIKPGRKLLAILDFLLSENAIGKLLFYKKDIDLDFYDSLKEALKDRELVFVHTDWVKKARMCKDPLEIEILKQNLMITELGYHYIIRMVEEGKTEIEIAAELEYFLRKKGAVSTSFDTIVASGERTALPHATASGKKIANEELLMFDFGIFKDGYAADFTRCYYFGKIIHPKIREIHGVVLEALKTAEASVKPGRKASDVHKAAFDAIRKAGYEGNFWHSTGHGVGIEVHELPAVAFSDETELKEGMVFTVEPGIYIPGLGGIRLEDMVVVTRNGCEVLTTSGYDL